MVVMSAWWVPYAQVHLGDTGFEVRGKKNYLPPAMLVLGYGILWTTEDEETMERHARTLVRETPRDTAEITADADEPQGDEEVDEPTKQDTESESSHSDEKEASIDGQEDKYNLAEFGSASEDDVEDEISTSIQTPTKQYLSAKQRRDIKRSKTQPDDDSDVDEMTSSISTVSLNKSKPQPTVRGKKGRQKKIKARYADQSDEERELARKLLGAKTELPEKPKTQDKATEDIKPAQPKLTPKPRLPPKLSVDEPLEVLT
jgi:hypothetical protein